MDAEHIVIGVGNRWRRDDGVGPIVAEAVADLGLPNTSVYVIEGECSGLLELWDGAGCVHVIDAATGPAAGTIQRFDLRTDSLPTDLFGCSSHNVGVVHAIELARVLRRLPERLIVYGVAGSCFEFGKGLSPPVAKAVPALVAEIQGTLATM